MKVYAENGGPNYIKKRATLKNKSHHWLFKKKILLNVTTTVN